MAIERKTEAGDGPWPLRRFAGFGPRSRIRSGRIVSTTAFPGLRAEGRSEHTTEDCEPANDEGNGGLLPAARALAVGFGVQAAWPAVASAHVGGGAFILLLPTHLYVAGGAIVVAASFALVALAPPRLFARLEVALAAAQPPGMPVARGGLDGREPALPRGHRPADHGGAPRQP